MSSTLGIKKESEVIMSVFSKEAVKAFNEETNNAINRMYDKIAAAQQKIKEAHDESRKEQKAISQRYVETLPIKVGDIVTHVCFNNDNVKISEEKVKIANMSFEDTGDYFTMTINHYSDKLKRWLTKEEEFHGIFEKNGVYYTNSYTPYTGGTKPHCITPILDWIYANNNQTSLIDIN